MHSLVARPTFEGRTVFVTRSVDRQEFRLRPDPEVTEAIKYLLMAVSQEYELSPHCICALSNHLHSVLTDRKARLPDFLSEFHGLIALCVNFIFGERGRLWDQQQTNRLYLDDVECLRKKISYTIANPTAAGLVKKGVEWPGLNARWPVKEEVVRRPKFFRRRGSRVKQAKGTRNHRPSVVEVDAMKSRWDAEGIDFPPYLVFRLERPPGFDELRDDDLAAELQTACDDAEDAARDARKKAGKRGYLGAENVLKTPRWSRSRKLHERCAFVPKVITRDKDARKLARQKLQWWHSAYADAAAIWLSNPDVEFPIGTYKRRLYYGAKVSATAPPGF